MAQNREQQPSKKGTGAPSEWLGGVELAEETDVAVAIEEGEPVMLGEDAIGSGVSNNRDEEQRTASAPPVRKTIMSEEITGE